MRSRFDVLLAAGQISSGEYEAGELWVRDFHAAAECSSRMVAAYEPRLDFARGIPEPDQRRLNAVRRQRETAAALGPERIGILERLLIRDLSWRSWPDSWTWSAHRPQG